tara:strand:+ start:134 stop:1579 length:1446 start_codon:yes stop_codon:yes gene_type:complete
MNKYFDFSLNIQQNKIFESLKDFTINDDDIFILKGYAGTGKTTMMSGLIKYLNANNITFRLLSSTGRAAKVLSDKTNLSANTIHSEIYSFGGIDEDLESLSNDNLNNIDDKGQINLLFELTSQNSDTDIIYIIDEASMISDTKSRGSSFAQFGDGDLLSDLFKYDQTGKFIFIGDPCQLPPINQVFSPALSKSYLENKFQKKVIEFELTQVMRQSEENDIFNISNNLRRLVTRNPDIKWPKLPFKNSKNIELVGDLSEMILKYIDLINNNDTTFSTFLCHSNRQCKEINKLIRAILYDNINQLHVGDLLLVTQNSQLVDLVNGDIVKIEKIGKSEYRCGLHFTNVVVTELASKNTFNTLMVRDIPFSINSNITDKQHKDIFIDFYLRMKNKGISQNSDQFNKQMIKDPYLNALKSVFGYAISCHKSQGGEWEELFLYVNKSLYVLNQRPPSFYQWAYTAVTRAKEKIYVNNQIGETDWMIN